MARYERVAEIYQLFQGTREPLPLAALCTSLGSSTATVKRLIRFLRDEGVPIVHDRANGGYVLDRARPTRPLMGPNYGAQELSSLLTAYELLAQIPPGLFRRETAAMRAQLESLLFRKPTGSVAVRKHVRLVLPQARACRDDIFKTVLTGLGIGRRLRIDYRSRSRDEDSRRLVSPQRLTFYRSNWYLAAWCHRSNGLRIFSLDRIGGVETTPIPSHLLPEADLDARLSGSYGIFEGPPNHVARLKFSAAAARWVADEQWHPDQRLERLADGAVVLQVPYRNATELTMDVLRYGSDVEVLGPAPLRSQVATALAAATARYSGTYAKVADLSRAS